MDVRHLRYVVAVADTASFTAAALRCFVAQPSLSQAIKTVEREVGVELFARLGRRVALTAAGEAFVAAARLAIRAFDDVTAEVEAVVGLVGGHLELVALPTLALDPVAPLVGAFRREHPNVVVRIAHPDRTDTLVRSIRSGESEIGITELARAGSDLEVIELGRQEIVVLFPPGSPHRRAATPSVLSKQPMVAQPEGTSTRALLDEVMESAGETASIAVETDQREILVPLVLQGAGAAVMPRPMGEAGASAGAVIVPFRPPLWRELALVHRPGPLSPAGRAFVALATQSGRPRPYLLRQQFGQSLR